MKTTNKIQVPFNLTFANGGLIPGRGNAGWTVAEFDNLAAAHAFAREWPEAEMPCWRRVECWGGKRLGQG